MPNDDYDVVITAAKYFAIIADVHTTAGLSLY